jgi:hypothetical protein
MVKVSSKIKQKTAKITGTYKNLKSSYSTRKVSRTSYLRHVNTKRANVNMTNTHIKRATTKKERRSKKPDTYLVEVKRLLHLLTEGKEDFSQKKYERHALIADSIMGSVSDIMRDIGREIGDEDGFDFVETLDTVIDEILQEYNDASGEDKDNLKDEIYLLASSVHDAIKKGNRIYKSLKDKPIMPTINENMAAATNSGSAKSEDDIMRGLLNGLSSLKIKK